MVQYVISVQCLLRIVGVTIMKKKQSHVTAMSLEYFKVVMVNVLNVKRYRNYDSLFMQR